MARLPKSCKPLAALVLAAALAACNQPAPGWDVLLTQRIEAQYPAYAVVPGDPGRLRVDRPGRSAVQVDVNDIAKFCLRGTRDCDYAIDQMMLSLQ